MEFPIVTAAVAATIALLQTGLMMAVGFSRLGYEQGIGDGGHADLELKIRRHGNLAENAALFLVLLALLELSGAATALVAGVGVSFVVVRISHAIALSLGPGPSAARFIGASGTALCFVVATGALGYAVLMA